MVFNLLQTYTCPQVMIHRKMDLFHVSSGPILVNLKAKMLLGKFVVPLMNSQELVPPPLFFGWLEGISLPAIH
jgi:hypothetical protein